MNRHPVWILVLVLGLFALLPDVAWACPVCFDANDENRRAFLATAVFLSAVPFGIMGGTGWWLRRRAKEIEAELGPEPDDGRPEV